MLGSTFYHETIRKVVIGFGTLFNDIHITRKDSSGNVQQSMKVPLAFGPKQKFLVRLREDPNIAKSVVILPGPRTIIIDTKNSVWEGRLLCFLLCGKCDF